MHSTDSTQLPELRRRARCSHWALLLIRSPCDWNGLPVIERSPNAQPSPRGFAQNNECALRAAEHIIYPVRSFDLVLGFGCFFGQMGASSSSIPKPNTPVIKKGWLTKKVGFIPRPCAIYVCLGK
jgi:hypothetical protein